MKTGQRRRLILLGSTGSIGRQVLDVVRSNPDQFEIVGLAAGANVSLLNKQIAEFAPRYAWCNTPNLLSRDGSKPYALPIDQMISTEDYDLPIIATVGSVGLRSSALALSLGKDIALANKEVVVMAGNLLRSLSEKTGARMLPIDSEHNAIWQCLQGETERWWDCADTSVRRLILTASGGALRDLDLSQLSAVTPEQALKHPTWQMGKKITVDCATLMNKGFEVFEARWLFGIPFDQIEVIVHRESIVHSLVEFVDGTVKAQLGLPDMRQPIQYAIAYPDRLSNSAQHLDLKKVRSLTFGPIPEGRYPCFELALEARTMGSTMPAVLSVADEVAVDLFLAGRIGFDQIHQLIEQVMSRHQPLDDFDIDDINEVDSWAREESYRFAQAVHH